MPMTAGHNDYRPSTENGSGHGVAKIRAGSSPGGRLKRSARGRATRSTADRRTCRRLRGHQNGGERLYYLGIGQLWDKDTGRSRRNYSVVARELGHMRESGVLPWEWLTDGTRPVRREVLYDSVRDALESTTRAYRRDPWASQTGRIEIRCESDSVGGVLWPVASAWGVGPYSRRGQSSKRSSTRPSSITRVGVGP
jgi:hypothetical protein